MRSKKTDPELPLLLPFRPGQASNGEFVPRERTWRHRATEALAFERAEEYARRMQVDRRRFLMGLGGLAVTLGAVNLLACTSDDGKDQVTPGGTFEMPTEPDAQACAELLGDDFIFDIQTHHVNIGTAAGRALAGALQGVHPDCGEADRADCFSRYYYLHDIFLESDTTMVVLSDTPTTSDEADPLTFEEMRRTREIIDELSSGGAGRILLHSIVAPNVGTVQQQLDSMQARAETMDVAAWKIYTPYAGTTGRGWFLDDPEFGIPVIEKARETGVKMICAHKGLPLFGFDEEYASPRDFGPVATAYPDVNFVAYHSGWYPGTNEGPYDPNNAERGVNALVKSLEDNGVGPNQNVYAELGSTWRNVMSDPTQAAHVLGKLLKYVGEDNVVWGTDCIWYGAPQPQIVAFRSFQIAPELRDQYGYPELTPEIRAKVFGLNAARLYGVDAEERRCGIARDQVEQYRNAYRDLDADSHVARWAPHGPISRRGMLRWFADHGGRWSLG